MGASTDRPDMGDHMSDAAPDTGDSAAAPASDTPASAAPPAVPSDTADLIADRDKWKALSRQHEQQSKSAAKELDALKREAMTEQERAVAAARDEAMAEAARKYGGRLVDAEVRAVAKGRVADVDALLEGLDRTRFLGDDFEPDTQGIADWVNRLAPQGEEGAQLEQAPPQSTGFVVDLGQGARGQPAQSTDDPMLRDVKRMLGIK